MNYELSSLINDFNLHCDLQSHSPRHVIIIPNEKCTLLIKRSQWKIIIIKEMERESL